MPLFSGKASPVVKATYFRLSKFNICALGLCLIFSTTTQSQDSNSGPSVAIKKGETDPIYLPFNVITDPFFSKKNSMIEAIISNPELENQLKEIEPNWRNIMQPSPNYFQLETDEDIEGRDMPTMMSESQFREILKFSRYGTDTQVFQPFEEPLVSQGYERISTDIISIDGEIFTVPTTHVGNTYAIFDNENNEVGFAATTSSSSLSNLSDQLPQGYSLRPTPAIKLGVALNNSDLYTSWQNPISDNDMLDTVILKNGINTEGIKTYFRESVDYLKQPVKFTVAKVWTGTKNIVNKSIEAIISEFFNQMYIGAKQASCGSGLNPSEMELTGSLNLKIGIGPANTSGNHEYTLKVDPASFCDK